MASNIKIKANIRSIYKDVAKSNRALANKIKKVVDAKTVKVQKESIKDFQFHPVTKEIDSGPDSSNTSGLTGGYGNLFSFIGFDSSDKPTAPIKQILNKKIENKIGRIDNSGKFKVTFLIPSKTEIYAATPLPWAAGSSWTEGIEKGIGNLGSFIYSSRNTSGSRSGRGIQTQKREALTFKTTSYISKILEELREKLKNL